MRTAIGAVVWLWSALLAMLYRDAPRITPKAVKLLRFGIVCFWFIVPAGIWVYFRPISFASPDVLDILAMVLVGGGTSFGLIVVGLALVLDTKRTKF